MREVTVAEECPTLGHCFHLSDDRVLVVSFSGCYRDGCDHTDAAYLRCMINLGGDLWLHKALVIDLSELDYTGGNMIESALSPFGIYAIVRPKYGAHLDSLLEGDDYPLFDDLDAALAYVRAEVQRQ